MIRRYLFSILYLLLAGSSSATTGAWSNLLFAIRERAETTRYSALVVSNPATGETWDLGTRTNVANSVTNWDATRFVMSPPGITQNELLSLGIVATSVTFVANDNPDPFSQPSYSLGSYGPVVTVTNIRGSWTNVFTWTNYVALDTNWRVITNVDPDTGWFDAIQPYGPLVSTNFSFIVPPWLKTKFPALSAAYEARITPHTIWQIDSYIYDLFASQNWVDLEQIKAAGTIDDYFNTYTGTNWYWCASNPDASNAVDDTWVPVPFHPLEVPRLTISNAWKFAGIEAQAEWTVETNAVTNVVYGWQVGNLHAYQVTNVVTTPRSNVTWRYAFPIAPTLQPFRVEIGQARIVSVTNTVVSNLTSVITNSHLIISGGSLDPFAMLHDDIGEARYPARLLTGGNTPAVWMQWVSATTSTLAPPAGLDLVITGLCAFVDATGVHRAWRTSEVATVAASPVMLAHQFYQIESITSPWSLDTDASNRIAGGTVSIIWSNAWYTFSPIPGGVSSHNVGVLKIPSDAVTMREKIVRQLQTTVAPVSGSAYPATWSWTGLNFYDAAFGGTNTEQRPNVAGNYSWITKSDSFSLAGTQSSNSPVSCDLSREFVRFDASIYHVEPQWTARFGGTCYEYDEHVFGHDTDVFGGYYEYDDTTITRQWSFEPLVVWPDPDVTMTVDQITTNLGATVRLVAVLADALDNRLERYEATTNGAHRLVWPYPYVDGFSITVITNSINGTCERSGQFEYGSAISTQVVSSDVIGPRTNLLAVLSTASKPAGSAAATLTMTLAQPLTAASFTIDHSLSYDATHHDICDAYDHTIRIRSRSGRFDIPRTERTLNHKAMLYGWQFTRLQPLP